MAYTGISIEALERETQGRTWMLGFDSQDEVRVPGGSITVVCNKRVRPRHLLVETEAAKVVEHVVLIVPGHAPQVLEPNKDVPWPAPVRFELVKPLVIEAGARAC